MDDLISRAVVVDAIDGVDWYHQNQHGEMVHGANPDEHQAWYKAEDIYKAVESVPSAQQWIPCSERLPEERINPNTRDFEYVLCVTIWGDVRPFKYGTPIGQKEAHFWNGAGYVDAYVTHWMPLPEPYKGDEDG